VASVELAPRNATRMVRGAASSASALTDFMEKRGKARPTAQPEGNACSPKPTGGMLIGSAGKYRRRAHGPSLEYHQLPPIRGFLSSQREIWHM
jgi:hypothetical protein